MNDSVSCVLNKKDFESDQQVKWCPGCGDYSVLNAVQTALPQIGKHKEDIVFVSGIGCSSRFPYYMDTYGFHTIHGRASAIASGVKLANPDLCVFQITGDGDALAIGGNHFIHLIRRNIDINILLFNNRIYGLTKGQFSPTSELGTVTKSSPHGTVEEPFSPGELALGAKSTFFARVSDANPKFMSEVIIQAVKHQGTSLIEILQNCVIFNEGVHDLIASKDNRDENQLVLEHGKPMIFGKEKNKGIIFDNAKLKVVQIDGIEYCEEDILVHDAQESDPVMHIMLTRMNLPEFPVAMGIIRNVDAPTYEIRLQEQLDLNIQNSKYKSLDDFFNSGESWEIN